MTAETRPTMQATDAKIEGVNESSEERCEVLLRQRSMWPALAAAALALATLAAIEPHGLFGDVQVGARKSDEASEPKPRLFDLLA